VTQLVAAVLRRAAAAWCIAANGATE